MKKLLLVFLIAASLHAADDKGLTGQVYRRMPEAIRSGYAGGFIDGYLKGKFFAADVIYRAGRTENVQHAVVTKMQAEVLNRAICFISPEITKGQETAILDKYIADHPEKWDEALIDLAEEAFLDACEKRAKKP